MKLSISLFACLLFMPGSSNAAGPVEIKPDRPALLKSLDGQWVMLGDVMGKPVEYSMEAFPTLQGTFTELHMTDVQVPPQYEARVFIGVYKEGRVIAHWLDSFGAEQSVPHGTGEITENSISFNIPYPSGEFRDKLIFEPEKGVWRLTIEGKNSAGTWEHFAKYTMTRKPAQK